MCEKKKTPREVGFGGADNGTRTRGLNLGKVARVLTYVDSRRNANRRRVAVGWAGCDTRVNQ